MSHAFDYCKTPRRVTKKELINALHESLIQLRAIESHKAIENSKEREAPRFLHNAPAIRSASECLKKAGHIGFTK